MAENIVTTTLRDTLGDLPEPTKQLVIERMVQFMRAMPQRYDPAVGIQVTGCRADQQHGNPSEGAKLTYHLHDLAAYVAYGFK